ncbi:hypothetical protein HanRHA438_Chr15g0697951 [Helianthus annuus]|nr:hypothetical protein HanRHA438_Chr15g0697951 [Helianthus annuus]
MLQIIQIDFLHPGFSCVHPLDLPDHIVYTSDHPSYTHLGLPNHHTNSHGLSNRNQSLV